MKLNFWIPAFAGMTKMVSTPVIPAKAGIQKNKNGFTLLELLLAIGIVGVVMLLSIPAWSHWINKNRLETASSELMRTLQLSRQTAIQKKHDVVICPSVDKKTCINDWSAPYVIAKNKDGLVASQELKFVRITWRSNLGLNDKLTFVPTGMTAGQQGSFVIGHFGSNSEIKRIVVLMSGAIYSQ